MKIKSIRRGSAKKDIRRRMGFRLASAAGGITVMIAAMSAFAYVKLRKEFGRGKYPDRRFSNQNRFYPDYSDSHERIEVSFMSGKNTLHGYIYGMENAEPKGLLVFAHGITVGHESYINQLMWFADHGWRVFAYDATGSCTSEGKGTRGLVQSALDLDKALSYAETDERLKDLPVYLLGHSWGGYAVCAVLNFDHEVKAAASMSGYAYPIKMLQLGTEQDIGKTAAKLFSPYLKGYNLSVSGKYSKLNAVDGVNKRDIPVLIIHGENDDFVDFDRVSIYSQRYSITNPNAEYLVLTGRYADHLNFFKCDEANDYLQGFYHQRDALAEKYGGMDKIPGDELEKLVKSYDKRMINTINTELLEDIERFYLKAADGGEPAANE